MMEEVRGSTHVHHTQILLEESMVHCFITNAIFFAGGGIVFMSYLLTQL